MDTKSFLMPNWITGHVSGGAGQDIAIAVNGTIRAVGNTFKLATGGGELFGVMVPAVSAEERPQQGEGVRGGERRTAAGDELGVQPSGVGLTS